MEIKIFRKFSRKTQKKIVALEAAILKRRLEIAVVDKILGIMYNGK